MGAVPISLDEANRRNALDRIARAPNNVRITWLREFGYFPDEMHVAICERGAARVARELEVHGKRLVDRQGPQCRT